VKAHEDATRSGFNAAPILSSEGVRRSLPTRAKLGYILLVAGVATAIPLTGFAAQPDRSNAGLVSGRAHIYYPTLYPSKLLQQPWKIQLDNHDSVWRLKWRAWGSKSARAHGRATVDLCEQTCARGPLAYYTANAHAWGLRVCRVKLLEAGTGRTEKDLVKVYDDVVVKIPGAPFRYLRRDRFPNACS